METLGIKTTIYDFFAYFLTGLICSICIILAIYFSGFQFSIPFDDIFGKELLTSLPNWFLLIIFILVNYIFGLLLATLSSMLIEKWLMKKVPFLSKYFKITNILSENIYSVFMNKFTKDFNFFFSENDIRLPITLVENKAVNSYNTAFVFLTLYGTHRNICLIFFAVGVISIIVNIFMWTCVIFGIILILLSIISLFGYIRFYRYFVSHIITAYMNIVIS